MSHYPKRKSPRLKGYDYSKPGGYFITICTHQRQHFFGAITDGIMQLNELGEFAKAGLQQLPNQFQGVALDIFVVMPNHVHMILFLHDAPQRSSLGMIVRAYKAGVTHQAKCRPLWQRQYHDHIIRNDEALGVLREYVQQNPLRWEADTFYS